MPWTELVVDLPEGPLRAQSTGEGPLLLWTHGMFHPIDVDDHSSLGRILPLLEGFRVVRYDTRGQGKTPASARDEAHRWHDLGRELLSLADALGEERFVAGGISMGAAVALHAAALSPGRVAGLVLLAPPTGWETRPSQLDDYRTMAGLAEPAKVARHVEAQLSAAFPDGLPPPLRVMVEQLAKADQASLGKVLRAAAESDLPPREAVSRLTTPALVLPWANDDGHPLSTAQAIAEALPGARLELVSGVDDVDGIVRAARGFLAALAPSLAQA